MRKDCLFCHEQRWWKNKNKLPVSILSIIFKYLPSKDCVVFLFGSFAEKRFNRGSDIDIGIICDKKIGREKLAAIKNDMEENVKTLRKIDMVDFYGMEDKEFIRIALRRVRIWHQTRKSKVFLSNLKKRING